MLSAKHILLFVYLCFIIGDLFELKHYLRLPHSQIWLLNIRTRLVNLVYIGSLPGSVGLASWFGLAWSTSEVFPVVLVWPPGLVSLGLLRKSSR